MKLSSKFRPLWEADYDYAVVTGGRASGKSFAVSLFLEHLTFEANHTILFSRYTMVSAQSSIIPEITSKIEAQSHQKYFDISRSEIINKRSGSRILFKGIKTSSGNQTAKLKSIEGLSTFILDEAEEADVEADFDTIDFSIRNKKVKNRTILILNPTTKESWVYKRFFENAGVQPGWNGIKNRVLYIHTSYLDNIGNLSEKFIHQVEQLRKLNPEKYDHIIMGGWLEKAEGVIYTNWELGEFDDSLPYGYGLDFGFSYSPDALVKVAVDEKRKLIYAQEFMYKTGQSTDVLIRKLKQAVKEKDNIVADSAEPRLISELQHAGLNVVKAKKHAGSVIEGIRIIMNYKIIVTPDSINLIKELNNYAWDDKKAEKPIDDYDHLLDSLRYYVSAGYRKVMFM